MEQFFVNIEFAARAHADRRVLPGGYVHWLGKWEGYTLNSSGIFTTTQLPNSKIDLCLGMFGFHRANVSAYPFTNRGIISDHLVEPNVNDVLKAMIG